MKQDSRKLAEKRWRQGKRIARIRARGDDTERLWKHVVHLRERLASCENFPVLNSLEESWRVLDQHYGGTVERARDADVADTPFESLMFHVDMGFYPPPELLLALADSYGTYKHGAGKLRFEDVLFGPPRRKAGGHAQQRMQHAKLLHMAIEMHFHVKEGHSTIQAAEMVSERFGGKPEPESIVRMLNAAGLTWIIKGL